MSWEAAVDSWLLTLCARARAHTRQVFPPLRQHGCMLVLPGYCSHAMIHTQIYASLFPLKRIQSWRLSTQQPADSIKVQRFAKLQHTGSLCSQLSHSVTTSTESGQSWPFYWLQNCWQPALAAVDIGFFLFYFPSCKYVWMFVHVHVHAFLSTHFNGIQNTKVPDQTAPSSQYFLPLLFCFFHSCHQPKENDDGGRCSFSGIIFTSQMRWLHIANLAQIFFLFCMSWVNLSCLRNWCILICNNLCRYLIWRL